MGTTPTPAPVTFSLSDILQQALGAVTDVETILKSTSTPAQKRQAVIDLASDGLTDYLKARGKTVDQQTVYGQLVTAVDALVALYQTLGL